jgi:microcystin-dependent protein
MPQILFPGRRFIDENGNPISGGKLYTYEAGTTTPLDTYINDALTTTAPNPIVLSSAGMMTTNGVDEGPIYVAPDDYRLVLKSSDDATTYFDIDDFTIVDPSTATVVVTETITANTSVAADDLGRLFSANTASGDITVTADSETLGTGFEFSVLKSSSDANSLIVSGTGVQTIKGSTTLEIENQFGGVTFRSNGAAGWDVLYQTPTSTVPTGAVLDFAGSTAPGGFLLCYGQAISRTDFANLFSVIGTTYGSGDGSTTFNLPDFRGRVVAGKDDMGGSSANRLTDADDGLDGDALGATGGGETQTLVEANVPPHEHIASVYEYARNRDTTTGGDEIFVTDGNGESLGNTSNVPVVTNASADTPNGISAPFGVVQPTIIQNKIIKT